MHIVLFLLAKLASISIVKQDDKTQDQKISKDTISYKHDEYPDMIESLPNGWSKLEKTKLKLCVNKLKQRKHTSVLH